jgi:hypothetical protein
MICVLYRVIHVDLVGLVFWRQEWARANKC